MTKKKWVSWTLYATAPLLLLILPFTQWTDRQLKAIVLKPQKTGIATFNFYDSSRERPVVTEVWYPVDPFISSKPCAGFWVRCEEARDAPIKESSKKYPLIIMSHGNGVDRFNLSWLAEILANNGYIVAAVDHYGNTWNNKIPKFYAKPWERPKDISFVIGELLNNSTLQSKIDENRIGFAGYSLGGATGVWIAGGKLIDLTCAEMGQVCAKQMPDIITSEVVAEIDFQEAFHSYSDPRISAVFALAPALGWLFDEKSLEKIQIPICIVAAAKDTVAPLEKNAKLFSKKIPKASLKILKNDSSHYIFLNCATLLGKRMLEPKFCEDPASVDRRVVHEEVGKTAIEFFHRHLK